MLTSRRSGEVALIVEPQTKQLVEVETCNCIASCVSCVGPDVGREDY